MAPFCRCLALTVRWAVLLDGLIEQQLDSNSGELVIVDGTEGVGAALAKLNDAGVEIIVGPCQKNKYLNCLSSSLFKLSCH